MQPNLRHVELDQQVRLSIPVHVADLAAPGTGSVQAQAGNYLRDIEAFFSQENSQYAPLLAGSNRHRGRSRLQYDPDSPGRIEHVRRRCHLRSEFSNREIAGRRPGG
jgi:hypothetical protein